MSDPPEGAVTAVRLDSILFATHEPEGDPTFILLVAIAVISVALVVIFVMMRRETQRKRKSRDADG